MIGGGGARWIADNPSMTDQIPLLIDTDPGVDDALALLMAFADRRHAVVGLGIAAGNVGLAHTVANALKLCEVAGRDDIPVFAGCEGPLLHAAEDAAFVHGSDGFGGTGYAPAKRAAVAAYWPEFGHNGKLDSICLNCKVTVCEDGYTPETYHIVCSAEADPIQGKISDESPLGRALLGRRVGDHVSVRAPGGSFSYEILSIEP